MADNGMTLTRFFTRAAQGHSLINQAVVTNDRCFANYHTHAVVDKDTPTNLCARVNVDAREKAAEVGNEPGQEGNAAIVQRMGQTVSHQRMQAGITAQHLQPVACCWVALKDDGKIIE
jgi:hypothetical protein